ncbi:Rrf2 family transcriptional regulator [bacterium]|nr:Rrf2 family transcriptional regulator [bacterium]
MALRLSTKARYGLRALISLARHYGEGPIMAKIIAKEEGISENYLEQIMELLRRSGVVRSVRGAQGGFILVKPPQDIKVKEIIDILEGPITLVDCLSSPGICEKSKNCPARILWEELKENITKFLESKTLADLIGLLRNSNQF